MLCNNKIILSISALFILVSVKLCHSSEIQLGLLDLLNKTTDKIYITENMLRFDGKREIKIIRLDNRKIYYLNPANFTFFERTFLDLEQLSRLKNKYNLDAEFQDSPLQNIVPAVKVILSNEIKTRNSNQKIFSLRYTSSFSKKTNTILASKIESLKPLMKNFLRDSIVLNILKYYWSEEELALMGNGFLPIKTSRMYSLKSIAQTNPTKTVYETPSGYKKRESEDYYADMFVQILANGLKKNAQKRITVQ